MITLLASMEVNPNMPKFPRKILFSELRMLDLEQISRHDHVIISGLDPLYNRIYVNILNNFVKSLKLLNKNIYITVTGTELKHIANLKNVDRLILDLYNQSQVMDLIKFAEENKKIIDKFDTVIVRISNEIDSNLIDKIPQDKIEVITAENLNPLFYTANNLALPQNVFINLTNYKYGSV